MNTYITKEYDFFAAINTSVNRDDLIIDEVTHLSPNTSLVKTSEGDFICESFGTSEDETYMKVYPFLQ